MMVSNENKNGNSGFVVLELVVGSGEQDIKGSYLLRA